MNEPYDPLAPENICLSPEQMAALQAVQAKPPKSVSRYGKQPKIKFHMFPTVLLHDLIRQKAHWSVFAVLTVLYTEWFTHPNHYNPVVLTTRAVRQFGVSRWQKYQALLFLERTGLIQVFREKRKNPLVTLTWLKLKEPGV
jgi:hypothetical protein